METVFIVGFYGAGSKMIAKLLASRKNLNYIDISDKVSEKEKKEKIDIINDNGTEYYKSVEKYVLNNSIEQGSIVSIDEDMVLDEDMRHIIKRIGRVFYLKAKPETLYNNLLENHDYVKKLKDNFSIFTITNMLNEYENYYNELRNYVINIDDKNINEILRETLAWYNYIHKFKCHIYM